MRQLHSRQGRRKSPYFVCEGVRCCQEALRQRPEWVEWALLATDFAPRDAGLRQEIAAPVFEAGPEEFARLAQTESPQGILLLMRRPEESALSAPGDPFVLALDRIGNPGNLGAILRAAWAAGLRAAAFTTGGSDPFGAKAIRAGMGAQFALQLHGFADLSALQRAYGDVGYRETWLATPHQGVSCFDSAFDPRRGILVLGNEAHGPTPCPDAHAVTIPMPGPAESLNVAQAAAVLLFQAVGRSESSP